MRNEALQETSVRTITIDSFTSSSKDSWITFRQQEHSNAMVRASRVRKSNPTAPRRKTDKRTRIPFKEDRTKTDIPKITRTRPKAHKIKQLRQDVTTSIVKTSHISSVKGQKDICKLFSSCSSSMSTMETKIPADTIVIEDTDEENEANIRNSHVYSKFFYEDLSPGLRESEIPLYETGRKLVIPADEICDSTVIELESTINSTQDSLSIEFDEIQLQPLLTVNLDKNANSKTVTNTCRNLSKDNLHVIDLSSNTDDGPGISSYVPVQSIPLGYCLAKPNRKTNICRKKRQISNSEKNDNKETTVPVMPILSALPSTSNSKQTKNPTKRMIVIDGNNVAYGHLNGKMFSVKGLDLCIQYFKKLGHEVVAVVPQYKLRRTQSTDQELLQKLHRQGDVILAPSKNLPGQFSSPYDDRLILSVAEKFDGVIVSNDNFRDLLDSSPVWRKIIETRVVGYTWVKDCFFLPDDPYGRQGPSLLTILNGYSA